MKRGKRYDALVKGYDPKKAYSLEEAVEMVKKNANAKFDESFDISMNLGIDPRKADQMVRGTVSLPHGTGKDVRVLVFAKTPKDQEALDAGADYAGLDEYVEKIQGGWTDIDLVIATPDVMGVIGRLGRVLGPRGLMPNPKVGTVTFDIAQAVKEAKAGKIEYRADKTGNVHAGIGKCSFAANQLVDNFNKFYYNIVKAKPTAAKGKYIKSMALTSTMGPAIKLDESKVKLIEDK